MTCTEKYLPSSVHRDSQSLQQIAARSLLKSGRLRISRKDLRSHMDKLKAAFIETTVWKKDPINIGFLGGSQHQKDWVKHIVETKLQPFIKTKLAFADPSQSDIRINFKSGDGAWSYIGNQANSIPKNQHTMNLGWIDDDQNYNGQRNESSFPGGVSPYKNTGHVIIHEFGHALGMIHEHQNPKENPIIWNRDVVINDLKSSNGWDEAQIEINMFKKYGDAVRCDAGETEYCTADNVNGSQYDKSSVMHYFFSPTWIQNKLDIPYNTKLSPLDVQWLQKYYGTPDSTTPPPPLTSTEESDEETVTEETVTEETVTSSGGGLSTTTIILLTVIAVLVLIIIIFLSTSKRTTFQA